MHTPSIARRIALPVLAVAAVGLVAGCGSSSSDQSTASVKSTSSVPTRNADARSKDLTLVVANTTAAPLTAQPTEPKGSFNVAPSTDPKEIAAGASETFHFDVPSWYATYDPDGGALRNPGPRFTLVLTQGDATASVPLRIRLSRGPIIPESPNRSWFVDAWAPGETSGFSCDTPWSTELGTAMASVTCSSVKLTKTPSKVTVSG